MEPFPVSETHWHSLRDVLWQDPSGMDRLDVRCAACYHRMTVSPEGVSNRRSHTIQILPCGHLVGHDCIRERFRSGRHDCPSCQESLEHSRCGHPCEGMTMPDDFDKFNQIPRTKAEGRGDLAMECTDCALNLLTNGIADIANSLDVGIRQMPPNQFFAYSVVLSRLRYVDVPEGTVRLRNLDIQPHMRALVKVAEEAFLSEWRGVWRTWQIGEFEIRFDLYEDSEYDSTTSKIKRSAKALRRMFSVKN